MVFAASGVTAADVNAGTPGRLAWGTPNGLMRRVRLGSSILGSMSIKNALSLIIQIVISSGLYTQAR